MEGKLKYTELKTGFANNWSAWIDKVEFSKSGKTIYFNGHAFKRKGHGVSRNIETVEIFRMSCVKKNGKIIRQRNPFCKNQSAGCMQSVILFYLNLENIFDNGFVLDLSLSTL